MPGTSSNRNAGTLQSDTASLGGALSARADGARNIVTTVIPVESVRGRVMSSLTSERADYARIATSSGRADAALARASAEQNVAEALAKIRDAYPESGSESEAYSKFLDEYRTVFAVSSQGFPSQVWEKLKSAHVFEASVIEYLKKMVPAIFKNKYSQSLYEDIEYGLYLLGSAQDFDILEDIRH